jgi:hypothetical protein
MSFIRFLLWSLIRIFLPAASCPICFLNKPDLSVDPELCAQQDHKSLIARWGLFWVKRCPGAHPEFGPCCHVRGHSQRCFTPANGGWSW